EARFGSAVRLLVEEVTDDKALPKEERKRLQVVHAPGLSVRARQIKLADKTCNVRDLHTRPPAEWSLARRRQYLDWARNVVDGCRGVNARLEDAFDEVFAAAVAELNRHTAAS